jgi:hypothetical protein
LEHKDALDEAPEDDIDNNHDDETGENLDDDDAEDDYVPYWGVNLKRFALTEKREKRKLVKRQKLNAGRKNGEKDIIRKLSEQ